MLEGKVAIVSGAGAGIGKAVSLHFASLGALTVLVDINGARVDNVAAAIREQGGNALACQSDVADLRSVRNVVENSLDTFGKIDILVNNAGLPSQHVEVDSHATWDKGIDQSLSSVFRLTEECLPSLRRGKCASIVNICSVNGNANGNNNAWYCAAKAGVAGFTRHLAVQYGREGIRANSVCLGLIRTLRNQSLDEQPVLLQALVDRTCLGRAGEPIDVAPAVAFLSSDLASYITGATLYIDGGLTIT